VLVVSGGGSTYKYVCMQPTLLILNVGSSSLKFAVYSAAKPLDCLLTGSFEEIGHSSAKLTYRRGDREAQQETGDFNDAPACLPRLQQLLGETPPQAIAHRIVHGGPNLTKHQALTPEVLAELKKITGLAPNHLPSEIAIIEAAAKHFPGVPQFACFDTVFHKDLPPEAREFPLPAAWRDLGVRRYGFHGLSYSYLMGKLPAHVGERANKRVVLAHLGSGCSLAAVHKGVCLDTTMGLTPLGGIMMATRPGDLDPGITGYLLREHGVTLADLDHQLEKNSGLTGIAGTGDVRELLRREATDPAAALALKMFCYSVRKGIAAMVAALQGLDVLVFSGGIGEHAHQLRARICEDLEYLGIAFDPAANRSSDICISAPASKVMVLAMETDEAAFMAETLANLTL
jgi:acetate kinase